jgi:molybdate transport system substrate-binding protein
MTVAVGTVLSVAAGCAAIDKAELNIFAAASLRDAFEAIVRPFEVSNPNTRVVLHFAGSQVLRAQIERGAQADVFASADEAHTDALIQTGHIEAQPLIFAQNELVLAVPADNPGNITSVYDLSAPEAYVVMGVLEVPVGRYAREMLRKYSTVTHNPDFLDVVLDGVDSFEMNVRLVAAKLELGAADAGLIYRTDVLASNSALVEISLPPELSTYAPYPIAVTSEGQDGEGARAFVKFVLSPTGQAILKAHGFQPAA